MRLVPDTSVLIEGIISKNIRKLSAKEVIIHETVLAHIEALARENLASGLLGIEEISRLRGLVELKFTGGRARPDDVDSLARELAYSEGAAFITSVEANAKVARAMGIETILETIAEKKSIALEKYFDRTTMSVHLRENVPPYAKKGKPGEWDFARVSRPAMAREQIREIAGEIIEEAKARADGFIEIERPGSTIVQLADFRIVITRPPFSDGWEITAVRPVRQMELDEYGLSGNLMERAKTAEGILIAGSPGMGKSTFASALARHYAANNRIVKTVEAPRDLVLPDSITQYSISHADSQEVHDILLLSRPDFTFFDEMRNTDDFRLFADLRLAGIGFIGIVHATKPIDAIQRFVGRIELGVIPQVIDTVLFIEDGRVAKVLSLRIVVKVPAGMTEADLARPVVVVSDFETGRPEFELYSYGEETVVIPVTEEKSPILGLAQRQLEQEFSKWSPEVEVEMISENRCAIYLPSDMVAKVIGKQGKNISEIEKKVGIGIDVRELKGGPEVSFDAKIMSKSIVFQLKAKHANRDVHISVNGDYLLTAKASKKGVIKVRKNNSVGRIIENALNIGDRVALNL